MTDGVEHKRVWKLMLWALLLLPLGVYADVLLDPARPFISNVRADLLSEYVHTRLFGFSQLAAGNLPLWNPHQFCGLPFFGGFQSALLYPPNWLYMILPLREAAVVGIVLHLFMIGAFTLAWLRYRGLHPLACGAGALIVTFSGAHIMHVHAGHLSNLCTMTWAPLVFLAIDGVFRDRSWRWVWLGTLAASMQVFAGHPQYLFYTAIACAIYVALMMVRAEQRGRVVAQLAVMVVLALGITAVQLLTGFDAASQAVRSQGLPYVFAAYFSLPPENLLTLIAPYLFGGLPTEVRADDHYWARWYLWEMTLFIGITGLFAAVYGAWRGPRSMRRVALPTIAILLVLALGSYTPLFRLLYEWAPGFDRFRGTAKFIFPMTLFMALLAAVGFDRLLRAPTRSLRGPAMILFAAALGGAAAALIVWQSGSSEWWRNVIATPAVADVSYLPSPTLTDPAFAPRAAQQAAKSLAIAALTCGLLAGLLHATATRPRAAYAVLLLVAVEVTVFARSTVDTFPRMKVPSHSQLADAADLRIMHMGLPNIATSAGLYDMWGNDPGVPLRYARFMGHTQGVTEPGVSQYVRFTRTHRWFGMLRGKMMIRRGSQPIIHLPDPMPRLQPVHEYQVLTGRDAIFAAMDDPAFDPRRTVILEQPPQPAPNPPIPAEPRSSVRLAIENESTDHMTIRAELDHAAILLITDGYARGWRARALPDSSQSSYQLLPANYVLRAVPLAAGRHHFVVEYAPRAFVIGKWISIATLAVYLAAPMILLMRRRSTEPS